MSFPSFAPWDITPSTFAQLLDCYPATLKESYKNKLIAISVRKHRKHPERLNREDPVYDKQTNEYMKLDDWRYETLPRVLKERAAGEDDGGGGGDDDKKKEKKIHLKRNEKYDSLFMHKEELVKLMEWKL